MQCKNSSAMEVLEKIAVLTYVGAKTHSSAEQECWLIRGCWSTPLCSQQQQQHSWSHLLFLKVTHCGTFPVRGRRQLRNRGILFSICPTAPFRNGDTGKKKIQDVAFQICEERASSNLKLLLRGFSLFLLCTGTNPGSRILFSGEEAGPASVRGTWAAFRPTVPCWPIT